MACPGGLTQRVLGLSGLMVGPGFKNPGRSGRIIWFKITSTRD